MDVRWFQWFCRRVAVTDFITGLQFLTRIRFVRQSEWTPQSFGESVKFFPLIGLVIGLVLYGFAYIAAERLPIHLFTAAIIVLEIALTGGLHCDGFMDTMDGLFSGRSRERMLEIMKDSRVGANGVVGFLCLLLIKGSVLLDLPQAQLLAALLIAPVVGRLAMVIGITSFPYARPEGMGKAFAQYADRFSLGFAAVSSLIIVSLVGPVYLISSMIGLAVAVSFACYVTRVLGGLTGDIYGALTEITQAAVFLSVVLIG
ncbi:adenosylcobinamide-GDP ribazoletransferase [Acetonema longum]|uniref:Adenosylcobinamide-GDP ribazoletransferase n=1 Tax=Acetonema longum DSM 6540 TaxID=1009370 RepID=F7NPX9_9FIRM|nr:adenosylcobinamide-GDP ribazoletransferase [Acetonema longum]EGO61970.1 cobalamin-5'-phosphate synthase [Acetonema longum DSM 6540]